jgi:hypothetical protein
MARALRPHGTQAAYKRHRYHGEIPCTPCLRASAEWSAQYRTNHPGYNKAARRRYKARIAAGISFQDELDRRHAL